MADHSPRSCAKRIENAIGILDLRLNPNGMDLMPSVPSTDLAKMILTDAATLLAHFANEEVSHAPDR